MSRKKMAAGVACAVLAMAFAAVMALWQPWGGGEGGSSSGDGAGSAASPAEDGYVGPTGRGAVSRDDYATDEEYIDALMAERNEGYPDDASREYEREYNEDGSSYDKSRIEVSFHRSCGERRAREIVAEVGGEWRDDTFAWDSPIAARVDVSFPGEVDEWALIERFEEYPEVEKARRYYYSGGSGYIFDATADDPRMAEQAYLGSSGFLEAWETTTCNWEVRVAVIDSGIDFDHEDLGPNVMGGLAFDGAANTIYGGGHTDVMGHGTMVAGVASARTNNALGIAGAAYNADVIPIRVPVREGEFEWGHLVNALEYLKALPDWQLPAAVNMSFSETEASLDASGAREDVEELIRYLREDRDVVFTAAAGNFHPEDEGPGALYEHMYPAALPGVLAVGNLGEDDVVHESSKRYAEVDLCAPGVGVLTTSDPDLVNRSYAANSGTSFSAPQVAAAAALVRAAHPDWPASKVEQAITETARKLPAMNGSNHTEEYGYGALDAAAAVAWEPAPPSPPDAEAAEIPYGMIGIFA